MKFEVWIRTFQGRLYLADRLKQVCIAHLTPCTHILNTNEASATYQEKFVLSLYFKLLNTKSTYILLLEDDIGFRKESLQVINKAIAQKRTHLWFTVPEEACLKAARKIKDDLYRVIKPLRFYYSGAILVSKNILQCYVENYLLNHMGYPYKNFDTTFSMHLSTDLGFIDLAPSYFGSLLNIESSSALCESDISRLEVERSALDPLFDPQAIVPELLSSELVL
jgi:hypothetical protein